MKEIPVLYSPAMVLSMLEGKKTQTRRIVKADHVLYNLNVNNFIPEYYHNSDDGWCPYGKPGTIMYVREEHYRYGHWVKDGQTKTGKQKWKFVAVKNDALELIDEDPFTFYYSDNPPTSFRISRNKKNPGKPQWYKRLARFMPKSAARIWLQVTDVRVERLQDITEEDAKAEGVTVTPEQAEANITHRHVLKDRIPAGDHQLEFCNLWREIHFTSLQDQLSGKDGWNENPWVWVVTFKVLSTTGKPLLQTEKTEV